MNAAGGEAVHAPDNVAGWLVLVCAYSYLQALLSCPSRSKGGGAYALVNILPRRLLQLPWEGFFIPSNPI